MDTRTPYVVDYLAEDAGKTAHYMLPWVATPGEKGPPALDGPRRAKPGRTATSVGNVLRVERNGECDDWCVTTNADFRMANGEL